MCLCPALVYCWLNPDHLSTLAAVTNPTFGTAEETGWLGLLIHNPVFHLPEFLAGIALSRLFRLRSARAEHLWGALLWCSLSVLALALFRSGQMPYPLLHNGLLLPILLIVMFCLSASLNPLTKVLSWRCFMVLGESSYAIYILQYPLTLLYRLGVYMATGRKIAGGYMPTISAFIIYFAFLCLVSVVTTKWIDTNLHKAVDRFFKKLLSPPTKLKDISDVRKIGVIQ